jgi:hypothetical protein
MPTVAIVDGVAIRFYPDEHPPPHFHAVFAEFVAQIRIAPPEVLRGSLPAAKLNVVLSWAGENREGLMEAWTALQAGRKPRRMQ